MRMARRERGFRQVFTTRSRFESPSTLRARSALRLAVAPADWLVERENRPIARAALVTAIVRRPLFKNVSAMTQICEGNAIWQTSCSRRPRARRTTAALAATYRPLQSSCKPLKARASRFIDLRHPDFNQ